MLAALSAAISSFLDEGTAMKLPDPEEPGVDSEICSFCKRECDDALAPRRCVRGCKLRWHVCEDCEPAYRAAKRLLAKIANELPSSCVAVKRSSGTIDTDWKCMALVPVSFADRTAVIQVSNGPQFKFVTLEMLITADAARRIQKGTKRKIDTSTLRTMR